MPDGVTVIHDELEQIVANNKGVKWRREKLEGRPHVVVPTVMIMEGVFNGSEGPIFYPKDELEKEISSWNHKPVVVNHPEIDGKPVSACDAAILNTQKVGLLLNTKVQNGKLKTEVWIDEGLADKVDKRILESVRNSKTMEVSTGLFVQKDRTAGEFGGKKYGVVARNHRPDHLAILPDSRGACSTLDGAGLLQNNDGDSSVVGNAMSFGNTHRLLQQSIAETHGYNAYVRDVYPNFFVYAKNSGGHEPKTFKQGYKVKSGKPVLEGTPEEVQQVVEYRTPDGEFVGNSLLGVHNKWRDPVSKVKQIVDELISNKDSSWDEADRDFLMGLPEDKLSKFKSEVKAPVANAAVTPPVVKEEPKKAVTDEEFIANAPPGVQESLRESLAARNAEKSRLVEVIVANKKNIYSKEYLLERKLDELRGIAALAAPEGTSGQSPILANYAGAVGAAPASVVDSKPIPKLAAPKMEYGKKK